MTKDERPKPIEHPASTIKTDYEEAPKEWWWLIVLIPVIPIVIFILSRIIK